MDQKWLIARPHRLKQPYSLHEHRVRWCEGLKGSKFLWLGFDETLFFFVFLSLILMTFLHFGICRFRFGQSTKKFATPLKGPRLTSTSWSVSSSTNVPSKPSRLWQPERRRSTATSSWRKGSSPANVSSGPTFFKPSKLCDYVFRKSKAYVWKDLRQWNKLRPVLVFFQLFIAAKSRLMKLRSP